MARAKFKATKLTLTSRCPEVTQDTGHRRGGSDIHAQLQNAYVCAGLAWHIIQRGNEQVLSIFSVLKVLLTLTWGERITQIN